MSKTHVLFGMRATVAKLNDVVYRFGSALNWKKTNLADPSIALVDSLSIDGSNSRGATPLRVVTILIHLRSFWMAMSISVLCLSAALAECWVAFQRVFLGCVSGLLSHQLSLSIRKVVGLNVGSTDLWICVWHPSILPRIT